MFGYIFTVMMMVLGSVQATAWGESEQRSYKGSEWEIGVAQAIRERKPLLIIHPGNDYSCSLAKSGAYSTTKEFKQSAIIILLAESDKAESFPPTLKTLFSKKFYGMKALILHPVHMTKHFDFALGNLEASGERNYFNVVQEKIRLIRKDYSKDETFPGQTPEVPTAKRKLVL